MSPYQHRDTRALSPTSAPAGGEEGPTSAWARFAKDNEPEIHFEGGDDPTPHFGGALLWTAALVVAQLIVGLFFLSFLATVEANDTSRLIVVILGSTSTTCILALILARVKYHHKMIPRLAWRGLTPPQWTLVLLSVGPLCVLASETSNCVTDWQPLLDKDSALQNFIVQNPLWIVFLGSALLPALGEEIFFRGILGRGLLAKYGFWVGMILTSLLFALIHIEPAQICGTFLLGMGMHYVYIMTRSLLAPVVLHMLNNALAATMIKNHQSFPVPGLSTLPADGVVHVHPILITAAVVAIIPTLLLLYQTRTRFILPGGRSWSPGYTTAEMPPSVLGARPVTSWPSFALMIPLLGGQALFFWSLWMANSWAAA